MDHQDKLAEAIKLLKKARKQLNKLTPSEGETKALLEFYKVFSQPMWDCILLGVSSTTEFKETKYMTVELIRREMKELSDRYALVYSVYSQDGLTKVRLIKEG